MKNLFFNKKAIVLLTLSFFFSCSSSVKKKNIIAEVNGKPIYEEEIIPFVQQELYDQLSRIYTIKNSALSQVIYLSLMSEEAKKNNLSYDEFVDCYIKNKIRREGKDSLLHRYNLTSRLPSFHSKKLYYPSLTSYEGKLEQEYTLNAFILSELVDSLKQKNNIKIYLYPPKSPKFNLNDLLVYYRGNQNSHVTVLIVSDFNCDNCINAHPLYDSIYSKYKDKIRFGYVNFSATPTIAEIACNAADKQGRFWQYHDSLYKHKGIIDSLAIYNIAENLFLDIQRFKSDIESEEGKKEIEKTIVKLVEMGIYATPTILVNGTLVVKSDSREEIEHLINQELDKR